MRCRFGSGRAVPLSPRDYLVISLDDFASFLIRCVLVAGNPWKSIFSSLADKGPAPSVPQGSDPVVTVAGELHHRGG